jgi:tetratricopeptide (TPR) repeat protein
MRLVRAAALNNSAWCRIPFGELEPARDRCLEAISLCRSLGYTPGEAGTWDTLGYVYQHLGDYAEAVRCFRTALQLGEASGNRLLLANTLGHLAETHALAGDLSAARAAWQRALDVYDDLRHRDGAKVRAKIRELDALSVRPAPGYLTAYRPAYARGGVRRLLLMVPLGLRQHPGLQKGPSDP